MARPPYADHLLPKSATRLERALSAVAAGLLAMPHNVIRRAWDPDTCPVHLLPYLAQAWSVDEWDPAWTEAQKRQAIRDSIWIHQHKGTIGALKRAIAQIGLGARVVRWFERSPRGAPYTFRLEVSLGATDTWSAANFARLLRVAIRNKAVRSLMDALVISRPAPPAPITIAAATLATVQFRYVLEPVTSIRTPAAYAYIGAATLSTVHTRLMPRAS